MKTSAISFEEFLSEGMVKVPQTMQANFTKFALYWYCACVSDIIEEHFQDEPTKYSSLKTLLRARMASLQLPELLDKDVEIAEKNMKSSNAFVSTKMKLDKSELPLNYKTKARTPEVEFRVFFKITDPEYRSMSAAYDNEEKMVFLHLSDVINVKRVAEIDYVKSVLIQQNMNSIAASIKHELMHVVQLNVLSNLNAREFNDDSYDSGDGYEFNPLEFQPLIVSEVAHFKSYGDLSNQAIAYFTGSSNARVGGIPKSSFFDKLYKKDREKWKKAIKLFTVELHS